MALQTNKNCATGVLEDYSGGPLKYGRLLCDGSVYLIANYPQLFALIGATYGGDGITTFAVPDIRGRVTAGQDNNPGSGYANRLTSAGSGINSQALGANGGQEVETLTAAQSGLPGHSVTLTGTTSGQSSIHTHEVGNSMGDTGADSAAARRFPSNIADSYTTTPGLDSGGPSNDHTHTWGGTTSVSAQNASAQHQVTQPTLVVIKTIMYA